MATTAYTYDPRFLLHDTGVDQVRLPSGVTLDPEPHPSSRRITRRTAQLVANSGLLAELQQVPARPASMAELTLVHEQAYIDEVRRLAREGGGRLDPDTPVVRGSWEAAILAVGTAVALTNAVVEGRARNAFGLVRPPGHHARPSAGMGFCIFNNVAVAARYARQVAGAARVAIVDWDVHHGNGTQEVFWDEPDVLFVSLHQDGWYPADSGAVDEVGGAGAEGTTVNVPLPPGTGDRGYRAAMERVVAPIVRQFEPEVILLSAGADAAITDPLGRMLVTREGFFDLTATIARVADDVCDGHVVGFAEGGYSAVYTPFCTLAVLEGLVGTHTDVPDPLEGTSELARAAVEWRSTHEEAVEAALDVQRRWWDL